VCILGKNKKRIIFAIILIIGLIFLLSVLGEDETTQTGTQPSTSSIGDTDWVIYWYLCGSDLESNYGLGTVDLQELLEVKLPENVKVVIQTGGTTQWHNELISADNIERYVYDSEGLRLIEQLPQASMGSEETLSDFLAFAKENYPAKKTGMIIWDHGGGSVTGVAADENYNNDSLTLDEMHNAFAANFDAL